MCEQNYYNKNKDIIKQKRDSLPKDQIKEYLKIITLTYLLNKKSFEKNMNEIIIIILFKINNITINF